MTDIKVYNMSGSQVGTMELNDSVFGVEYKESLIHQAVVTRLANERQGTKSTLTRTEVRGGGAKPWRQKGTGRARQGSIRAPQWIKGGVVFAPKPRDFSKKVNQKAKKGALYSALSYKVANNEFIVVDEIALAENKTKEVAAMLKALGVCKRAVIVTDGDAMVARCASNIENVTAASCELLSVYEVVVSDKVVITKGAVNKMQEACE